jgi:hypothetical protein
MSEKLAETLRRTTVVIETAAESLAAPNATGSTRRWDSGDQFIAKALVISFTVIVGHEFVKGPAEVLTLPQRNNSVETLVLDPRSTGQESAGGPVLSRSWQLSTAPRHAVSRVLQRTLKACIAPARVFSGHSHDEFADLLQDPRPSRTPTCVRPLPNDQPPMPSKDRVWCDDRRDLVQDLSSQAFSKNRQTAALVVAEVQSAPGQLRLQDPILFS